MHASQVFDLGLTRLHLLHMAVQREQVATHGLSESPQAPLVLRVAPTRIVQGRRWMQEEPGSGRHRQATTGATSEAMRSWIERTSC
jgi:hypothetical protein